MFIFSLLQLNRLFKGGYDPDGDDFVGAFLPDDYI